MLNQPQFKHQLLFNTPPSESSLISLFLTLLASSSSEIQKMVALRAWLLLSLLAFALLTRSTTHAEDDAAPGDPQAPENQEEEALSVNVPSSAENEEDDKDDDELPLEQELVVLGH